MGEVSTLVLSGCLFLLAAAAWQVFVVGRRRRREKRLLDTLQLHTYRQRLPDFQRELNRARRTERQLSVVVLALDSATSKAAAATREASWMERLAFLLVGSMLRELLREHDIVAYDPAADRYVLLLVESARQEAAELIHRIRKEVEVRTSLPLRGGVALLPEDGLTIQELVRNAGDRCDSWQPQAGAATPERVQLPSQAHATTRLSSSS